MNPPGAKALPSFIRVRLSRWKHLQSVAGNTMWLLVDRIVRLGLGLYLNIRIARYLGPEQFGLLNYATAFVTLFIPVATLSLDSIVVRDLVREPQRKHETLGAVLALRIAAAVFTILLAVGLILLLRPDDGLVHWLVGVTAIGAIFQAFDTIDLWFQSQLQSRLTVWAKNSAFLLLTAVKLLMIKLGAPLIAFAWAASAELLAGAIGLIIAYQTQGNHLLCWRSSLQRIAGLLRNCWPLALSGFAAYLQAKSDQVLVGDLIGDAELGQYSVALRLVEVLGFIPMVIQSSVAPAVTRAKTQGDDRYYQLLLNIYRLMFALFVATAAPLFFFSAQLVALLFGSEYAAAGALLPLFSVRLFFTNFGVAKNLFIVNNGLFKYSLVMTVAGAVANLALNYLLIPRYASPGAIAAMGVSFLVNTFLIDLFYPQMRRNLRAMVKAIFTPWRLRLSAAARQSF